MSRPLHLVGHPSLMVSEHALERYVERVRPALATGAAFKELACLAISCGRVETKKPAWASLQGHGKIVGWLLVGDDVAFPVMADRTLPTCLTRGGMTPAAALRKAERRKRKRNKRRYHVRGQDPRGGRDWEAAA